MKRAGETEVAVRNVPWLIAVSLMVALGLTGCGGGSSSSATDPETTGDTSSAPPGEAEGPTYVALGDSWPEGAHCNGCRTFPQTHAEALSELLGEPVTLHNLSGQAQPYFESLGGGGSAGLRSALETDEAFREEVAAGDIIVISTGPNDGDDAFEAIQGGTCEGADDAACVGELDRRWHRDFDAILAEIEELRAGQPTAVRLVNAANAFNDPSFSPATLRGFDAYFEALTDAMCDNAKEHDAVCVDVRPALNGPDVEQPVNDSSQESMDAVAALLLETGVPELE
jgi:GDSL-like Lipase/Acylhydrolase family